jgi:hypothetical protein
MCFMWGVCHLYVASDRLFSTVGGLSGNAWLTEPCEVKMLLDKVFNSSLCDKLFTSIL